MGLEVCKMFVREREGVWGHLELLMFCFFETQGVIKGVVSCLMGFF